MESFTNTHMRGLMKNSMMSYINHDILQENKENYLLHDLKRKADKKRLITTVSKCARYTSKGICAIYRDLLTVRAYVDWCNEDRVNVRSIMMEQQDYTDLFELFDMGREFFGYGSLDGDDDEIV